MPNQYTPQYSPLFVTCETCGKVYRISPSRPGQGRGRFCSWACRRWEKPPLAERFWTNVNKTETCWLWTGATYISGYGKIHRGNGGSELYAHRVSWELHVGPIPPGLWILHHCDTPLCVRPDHLFLGTQAENMKDAAQKGRMPRGVAQGQSKLNDDKIREIRRLLKEGRGQTTLARQYAVTQAVIWRIAHHLSWQHVVD